MSHVYTQEQFYQLNRKLYLSKDLEELETMKEKYSKLMLKALQKSERSGLPYMSGEPEYVIYCCNRAIGELKMQLKSGN